MSIELAKAHVRVRADTSQLRPDLMQARSQVTGDASVIGASIGSSLTAGISKSFIGGITGVSLFAGGILRKGLSEAADFEQTTISFETMLGSIKETQTTLASLTKFAAETPFEMPEILQAARGLIQFGEHGDEMVDTMKMLGNAASASSTPFGFLALVFNQVRGVGKLLTQDFRQLSTRGIISLQDIAKHYKVTTAAAQDMLSKGKISFDDFKAIMEGLSKEGGRFYNMMIRQSQSLTGLESTLADAWNIMTRQLAGGLVPAMKLYTRLQIIAVEGLSAINEALGDMSGWAMAGAVSLTLLASAFGLAAIGTKLLGISLLQMMVGSGIALVFVAAAAGAGMLVGMIAKLISWMSELSAVTKPIADGWAMITAAFEMTVTNIKIGISRIIADFQGYYMVATGVFTAVAVWAAQKFNELGAFAMNLATGLGVIFRNIGDFFRIILIDMQMEWLEWKMATIVVFHSISTAFSATFAAIGAGFMAYIGNLKNAFAAFGTFVSSVFSAIGEVIMMMWDNLLNGGGEDVMMVLHDKMLNAVQTMQKDMKDGTVDTGAVAKKAFEDSVKASGPAPIFGDAMGLNGLKAERDQIIAKIAEAESKPVDITPEGEEAPPPPGAPEAAAEKKNDLTGKYRVEEFGNTLQDAVLKKEDKQGLMVTLLEVGNTLQQQQLEATKDKKPMALAGDS